MTLSIPPTVFVSFRRSVALRAIVLGTLHISSSAFAIPRPPTKPGPRQMTRLFESIRLTSLCSETSCKSATIRWRRRSVGREREGRTCVRI